MLRLLSCLLTIGLITSTTVLRADEESISHRAETLEKLVAKYNHCLEKGQIEKAQGIAEQLTQKYPDHPVAKLLKRHFALAAGTVDKRTEKSSNPDIQTRIYAVADLVIPIPQHLRIASTPQSKAPEPKTSTDFDQLTALITKTIDPESWQSRGGVGRIEAQETTLSLVISQTPGVHEQIADLLSQLRRTRDVQVTLETRFIEVTDNFFERSGVDFDFEANDPPESPNLHAIMPDRQSSTFLDAVQSDERANVRSAPKITLFNGQHGEIVTGTKSDPSSQHFAVGAVVSADRRSIRVTFTDRRSDSKPISITVPNGDSLFIPAGEYIREGRSERGVPILNQTPYVSRLFKSTGIAREKVNRLILITPRVIIQEEEEVLWRP